MRKGSIYDFELTPEHKDWDKLMSHARKNPYLYEELYINDVILDRNSGASDLILDVLHNVIDEYTFHIDDDYYIDVISIDMEYDGSKVNSIDYDVVRTDLYDDSPAPKEVLEVANQDVMEIAQLTLDAYNEELHRSWEEEDYPFYDQVANAIDVYMDERGNILAYEYNGKIFNL